MEPIVPITPRIPNMPGVERVGQRVDPEQQKREQKKREQKRREPDQNVRELPEEDDGLPHIDISV
jgi:hypothetical protein